MPATSDRIRVVVVEDHSRRPNAVRDALDHAPGLRVINVISLTPDPGDGASPRGGDVDPLQVLSVREREVLALVARALSNRQIGGRLSITEGTVKRHLRNIFSKLGAVSRIDAVNKAVTAGVIGTERRSAP